VLNESTERRPDDWLDLEAIAGSLGCTVKFARKLLGSEGAPVLIPHFKFCRRLYALRRDVEAFRVDYVTRNSRPATPADWQGRRASARSP